MTIQTFMRALVVTTALSLTAAAAVARSTELVPPPRTEIGSTASPVTVALLHKAIVAAGQHHGWMPVADAPGVLTMRAVSGSHSVTVDVAYDTQGYQVKFKSSTNMNQSGSGDQITIHPHVNKWLSDLSGDIMGAVHAAATQAN